MNHGKQLTPYEEKKIFLLYYQNKTSTYIAETIHRDKATIWREIARNCRDGVDSPSIAHTKCLEHHTACSPKL